MHRKLLCSLCFISIILFCGIFASEAKAKEKFYYIHSDHLGSVSLITDEYGNPVSQQSYYPYGETRLSTSGSPTERAYTGQVSDTDQTGLYYYNARYYNPQIAKFTQSDIINNQNNKYQYVSGNPLKFVDPSGMQAEGKMTPLEYLTEKFDGNEVAAQSCIDMANSLNRSLRQTTFDWNERLSHSYMNTIAPGLYELTVVNNWDDNNYTVWDIYSMNRSRIGNMNLAFALSISGQESTFFTWPENAPENPFNAHFGEFLITARMIGKELGFVNNTDDSAGRDDLGDEFLTFYLKNGGRASPEDRIPRRTITGNFMALMYHLRHSMGFTEKGEAAVNSPAWFDFVDKHGNMVVDLNVLARWYAGKGNSNDVWISNVDDYYNDLRDFAQEYPEFGFLFQDISDIRGADL